MNQKITVLLFDVAGVLFPVNTAGSEDLEERFGLTPEQQIPIWKGADYVALSTGVISVDTFFDRIAAQCNLDRSLLSVDAFTSKFKAVLAPTPGINELLKKLHDTGITMAILSDTNALYASIRENEGYYAYFEKTFLSHETGFLKPDPRAYQQVIEHYNVSPHNILFIDDKPGNVAAAEALGMQGIVFTTTQALASELHERGVL